MVHKIVSGLDLAERDKILDDKSNPSQGLWIKKMSKTLQNQLGIKYIYNGEIAGKSVVAFINGGRWSAMCPTCGPMATEYVNSLENIFYCFNCGNESLYGKARPVVFPSDEIMILIEEELLKRPMRNRGGNHILAQALQSTPIVKGVGRNWFPPETVLDLQAQNKKYLNGRENIVKDRIIIKEVI